MLQRCRGQGTATPVHGLDADKRPCLSLSTLIIKCLRLSDQTTRVSLVFPPRLSLPVQPLSFTSQICQQKFTFCVHGVNGFWCQLTEMRVNQISTNAATNVKLLKSTDLGIGDLTIDVFVL